MRSCVRKGVGASIVKWARAAAGVSTPVAQNARAASRLAPLERIVSMTKGFLSRTAASLLEDRNGMNVKNFSFCRGLGKDASVDVVKLSLLCVALTASTACSPSSGRMPRQALIARAWSGGEPSPTEQGRQIVAFAARQIGKPYCWGGTGPRCFDCSGLTQSAYGSVGVHLPRTTGDIAELLPEVPLKQASAGDILWWPGHVGIYAGGGWVIDALDSRHGVVVRPANDPYRAYHP